MPDLPVDPSVIRQMLDRESIRDLPNRYCHAVWQRDIAAYVDLFTPDGAFFSTGSQIPEARGHAQLREMLGSALQSLTPFPFIHNHVITVLESDRAEGVCYAEVRMVRDGEPNLTTVLYNDEYAKVTGEWKFRTRTAIVKSVVPLRFGSL